MSWDRLENGGLSSTPTSRWILRTYAMLTPNLGFDSATTMHEEDDHISADVALIYRLFAPRFHLYMALIDVFSGQVDRRFGISYAIGVS